MSYSKEEIAQGLAETFHYSCSRCGQGNLSRDEVTAAKSGYICLRCLYKDCLTETLGTVSNEVDKEA